jgi:hypothetical protein
LAHLLEHVAFIEKIGAFGKVRLSVLLEKRFGDKFRVVLFNKKLFVKVIGLTHYEQSDCLLHATLLRDQGEEWKDLKKNIVGAAEITLMQEIAF